ncbi:MAG: thiamine-phosphate kinase [Gammaproteobacteria bacterium]
MKKISENEIIKIASKNNKFREEVLVPIGEDASVLFPIQDSNIVITTDTMTLNTHFKNNIKPYELGYISAASNISDLSAMGATPAFALINLTLMDNSESYISDLVNGYNSVFESFQISLIGGDTTYGQTSLTMTLIGYTSSNNHMLTSSSEINDTIFISGPVGSSLAALKENKYNLPLMRNELGTILPDFANSCTDMSDGLLKSLKMIGDNSNLGFNIDLSKIEINKNTRDLLDNKKICWQDILSYGEDYELLFTVSNDKVIPLKNTCKNLGFEIFEIGNTIKSKEIIIYDGKKKLDLNINQKFNHFK